MAPTSNYRKALIVQGGGFRTAFTAGILDAFLDSAHLPFDLIVANSGGAIASSYFLAEQRGLYIASMKHLAADPHFIQYSRFFHSKGLMDVDYFKIIASEVFPFDMEKALHQKLTTAIRFVATSCNNGNANYLDPQRHNWMDTVIASCALPFITKGSHLVDGQHYFDGGWSDALPVKWAFQQGASDILILRTAPANHKINQSWTDWIGANWHFNKKVRHTFQHNHRCYNDTIDFINQPPLGLNIEQIAPEKTLKSSTYTKKQNLIDADYEYGYQAGCNYLNKLSFSSKPREVING